MTEPEVSEVEWDEEDQALADMSWPKCTRQHVVWRSLKDDPPTNPSTYRLWRKQVFPLGRGATTAKPYFEYRVALGCELHGFTEYMEIPE